jgi:hypothetical protein
MNEEILAPVKSVLETGANSSGALHLFLNFGAAVYDCCA